MQPTHPSECLNLRFAILIAALLGSAFNASAQTLADFEACMLGPATPSACSGASMTGDGTVGLLDMMLLGQVGTGVRNQRDDCGALNSPALDAREYAGARIPANGAFVAGYTGAYARVSYRPPVLCQPIVPGIASASLAWVGVTDVFDGGGQIPRWAQVGWIRGQNFSSPPGPGDQVPRGRLFVGRYYEIRTAPGTALAAYVRPFFEGMPADPDDDGYLIDKRSQSEPSWLVTVPEEFFSILDDRTAGWSGQMLDRADFTIETFRPGDAHPGLPPRRCDFVTVSSAGLDSQPPPSFGFQVSERPRPATPMSARHGSASECQR